MGMYTELNIAVNLKLTDNIRKILEYMTGDRADTDFTVPTHPLFESPRWEFMLMSDSFYFDHTANSSLVNKKPLEEEDDMERIINVRCDLKDYSDEIKHFLDWIYPFTKTRGFIGYTRYEENENPTLIYFTDRGVEYKEVD